jgi:hypothetical protein
VIGQFIFVPLYPGQQVGFTLIVGKKCDPFDSFHGKASILKKFGLPDLKEKHYHSPRIVPGM